MGLSRSQVQKLPGGELLGLCKRLEIHRAFETLDDDRARSLVLPKLLARGEGDSQDLDPLRLEKGPGLLSGLRHPSGLGEVDDVTGLRVGKTHSFEDGPRPRGRQARPGRAAEEPTRTPVGPRLRGSADLWCRRRSPLPPTLGWLPIGGALGYGISMVRIAVDAMGGDDAPAAVVQGACEATRTTGATLELVGDPDRIEKELARWPHDRDRIIVIPAEGFIPMDAKPREALAAAPRASLPVAAARVGADGGPDALVSAGNTGAVVLACSDAFRRLPGVRRTALAAVVPTARVRGPRGDPFCLLLDVGATLRVEAYDLATFAQMGAAYAAVVGRNPRPRVALLSNGTEATKGPPEVLAAHPLLAALPSVEFLGNIESLHLPQGVADVVVCDGFTGNVTLKMLEGMSEVVTDLARYAYRSKWTWKLALWLLRGGIRRLREVTDWEQYGGAPILGFDRVCIKAHGRSGPRAIRNAIRVAERCVEQDLSGRIAGGLAALPALHNPAKTAEA